MQKRKKEKERLQELLDRLAQEQQQQQRHVEAVARRMQRDKGQWFAKEGDSWRSVGTVVHHCLLPRMLMSAEDAVFCAR